MRPNFPSRIYWFTSEYVKEAPFVKGENWTTGLPNIISETRKTGGKLLLLTHMKLHMGFSLVPKLVTLNDLERRNGRYFALFRRIW